MAAQVVGMVPFQAIYISLYATGYCIKISGMALTLVSFIIDMVIANSNIGIARF